jgi:hypothetical protein
MTYPIAHVTWLWANTGIFSDSAVIWWLSFCVVVAVGANTRGRNPYGWFALAFFLLPLLAGLLLLALPRREVMA